MSISIEISVGEFLDKLTILELKKVKINDNNKLQNINKEYDALIDKWKKSIYVQEEITVELELLKKLNECLWEIEEKIREKERNNEFDEAFVDLARSVYITNDKRSEIKRILNEKLRSGLIEEKSY